MKIKSFNDFTNEELNLKKLATGAALGASLALGDPSFGQSNKKSDVSIEKQEKEIVPDLLPFADLSKRLFISKVFEIPSKDKNQLFNKFKNWTGTKFVNAKNVTVSETEDQIVIKFLIETVNWTKMMGVKAYFDVKHHVSLVAQFKDGKMRIQLYDNGNAYRVTDYPGLSPSLKDKQFYISDFYSDTKPAYKDTHKVVSDGHYLGGKACGYIHLHQWQMSVKEVAESCENYMNEPDKNSFDFEP